EIDDRTYNENEIQYLNNLLKKAFTCREVGDKIAAGLSDEDLKNMALAIIFYSYIITLQIFLKVEIISVKLRQFCY
ncbi:hypothetical protein LOAG_14712, partial [Loa loa]